MGLNGIYPVNFYPYNIQINKKKSANKVQSNSERPDSRNEGTNAGLDSGKKAPGYSQSIDYSSDSVNISRILADFKSTLGAIGATKSVNEEVLAHLKLVELQAQKEVPSSKLIKSNLMNAASVLDGYIEETLKKPSSVVKNWIEALLLQKVDYRVENLSLAENKLSKTDGIKISQIEESGREEEKTFVTTENPVTIPLKNDSASLKLEKLYRKSEIILESGNYQKALEVYEKLIPYSKKLGNKEIEGKLYMDKAHILDKSGDYKNALENYSKAANIASNSSDLSLQASAHYNIGSIYDDFGNTGAALVHYYESVALDGEVENLKGQSLALNDIGNIYAFEKEFKKSLEHFNIGVSLADEAGDENGKACLLANSASVFRDLGMDDKALKLYKSSIKLDVKTGNIEGYAKSLEASGDIMLQRNFSEKALQLYKKSLSAAQKVVDPNRTEWIERINNKISQSFLGY